MFEKYRSRLVMIALMASTNPEMVDSKFVAGCESRANLRCFDPRCFP